MFTNLTQEARVRPRPSRLLIETEMAKRDYIEELVFTGEVKLMEK